jgi:hypothetical protein
MSDEKEKHASNINVSISELLNSETVLKRKKKTEEDRRKEMFESIVTALEKTNIRSELTVLDLNLDFSKYDEPFYAIIDGLLELNFGKNAVELIYFYIFDRVDEEGNNRMLVDENGNEYLLQTPSDLWELMQILNVTKKK